MLDSLLPQVQIQDLNSMKKKIEKDGKKLECSLGVSLPGEPHCQPNTSDASCAGLEGQAKELDNLQTAC